MPPTTRVLCSALLCASALSSLAACRSAAVRASYERRELSIPMRDGVHLFAVALTPNGVHEPLPILLVRTPYSAATLFHGAELPAEYRELAKDGCIFVAEDIRGRFGSEGTFVMLRGQSDPPSPRGTNESTDAYDTIDWLVKHLPGNNGKVGALGISCSGWLAALAAVGAHPARGSPS